MQQIPQTLTGPLTNVLTLATAIGLLLLLAWVRKRCELTWGQTLGALLALAVVYAILAAANAGRVDLDLTGDLGVQLNMPTSAQPP